MTDQPRNRWIGQPLDRVDGPAKVTGRATYAADHRLDTAAAIGVIVEAAVGAGRVTRIDTAAAEGADGVLLVMTPDNAPEQTPFGTNPDAGRFGMSHAVLENGEIRHFGWPVALVVAETLEQARHAAMLVTVEVDAKPGIFDAERHEAEAEEPDSLDGGGDAAMDVGDFDQVWAEADVKVEAEFHTGAQHAAAMEPHATLAEWDGDRLTVHTAIQILGDGLKAFANTLRIRPADVRILSPYVGGGFGSKLGIHNEAVLAALAAKSLDRPVRIAQSRRNVFHNGPHRSGHRQRLKLAAAADGTLLAISHENLAAMARDYPFAEEPASPSKASYAAKAIRTRHLVVEADIPKVDSMRAPGEAVGTLTFESMIDELAEKVGMDPVAFRMKNEPDRDPASGKPFASRTLARCLKAGAERFGWKSGKVQPGGNVDGDWLIGRGVAASIRPNFMQEAGADAILSADGRLALELDMTDIGTGTYTILTQIAAESMGLDPADVEVRLGDSAFPETCGSGGSFGAGSTGSAVLAVCDALREDLLKRAARLDPVWEGANADDIRIADGSVSLGDRSVALSAILEASGGDAFRVRKQFKPGPEHKSMAQYSYGAIFSEVGVDRVTGEIRVRRMLGVFDAGRILNEKTARSQLMGGMIFGLGAALLEESLMDMRYGAFMNRDLAEYHIAVNRDVPALEVHMLDAPDANSNPLGSKGIGELGICGAGPSIANAIYAATGFRARKFPIHLEDLLPHLP